MIAYKIKDNISSMLFFGVLPTRKVITISVHNIFGTHTARTQICHFKYIFRLIVNQLITEVHLLHSVLLITPLSVKIYL